MTAALQAFPTAPIASDVASRDATNDADARDRAPLSGLAGLLLPTEPVRPETSVLDVAQQFLDSRHAGLLSLPVVAVGGRPVGMISRYELMRVFLQPYGRELYGRRPITALMDRAPLVLPLSTSIDEAARTIAAHVRSPITDDFVLVDDAGYAGTGLVLDVLHAVEHRLAERSRELERAYARLKASQSQLVQSEKMASLGQMVAGLVHEINTPLGYVRNNVEMTRAALGDAARLVSAQQAVIDALTGEAEPDDDLDTRFAEVGHLRTRVDAAALDDLCGLLDDTVHGVGQIGELVLNLKDFSRLDQAGLQKADINRLVESALRIVAHVLRKRDIEVVLKLGEIPPLDCAPAQINQVLLNLLSNAAQAIEHERGRIVVATQALDRRVLVVVEDNGKGIEAEHLSRVFDPFFTTKPVGQGTGMGLAISHQIVEQHGGAIRVSSKPGTGTRFLVVLPVSGAAGAAP
ncbi:signal transduction histidine kinase [Dokdonella fugitiva]|uniref:histidine kinase n=1 Tax=Dokdonella fugitiva TaxID=328517 RepID=A0A839F485_9GAMM|nr:ATP-binding protein [Dokdonella fugitiva]MBA8889396.1 signal transduction histidine kinase [Dokdonella fugitiva]